MPHLLPIVYCKLSKGLYVELLTPLCVKQKIVNCPFEKITADLLVAKGIFIKVSRNWEHVHNVVCVDIVRAALSIEPKEL